MGKFVNSQTKILFNKKDCHHKPFLATPNNMLHKDYGGCPECGAIKRKNTKRKKYGVGIKEAERRVKKLYPDGLYVLKKGQTYINNKTHLIMICGRCGNEFPISLVNIEKGKGCPICNKIIPQESRAVKKIKNF